MNNAGRLVCTCKRVNLIGKNGRGHECERGT